MSITARSSSNSSQHDIDLLEIFRGSVVLPGDLVRYSVSYLGAPDFFILRLVSRSFYQIINKLQLPDVQKLVLTQLEKKRWRLSWLQSAKSLQLLRTWFPQVETLRVLIRRDTAQEILNDNRLRIFEAFPKLTNVSLVMSTGALDVICHNEQQFFASIAKSLQCLSLLQRIALVSFNFNRNDLNDVAQFVSVLPLYLAGKTRLDTLTFLYSLYSDNFSSDMLQQSLRIATSQSFTVRLSQLNEEDESHFQRYLRSMVTSLDIPVEDFAAPAQQQFKHYSFIGSCMVNQFDQAAIEAIRYARHLDDPGFFAEWHHLVERAQGSLMSNMAHIIKRLIQIGKYGFVREFLENSPVKIGSWLAKAAFDGHNDPEWISSMTNDYVIRLVRNRLQICDYFFLEDMAKLQARFAGVIETAICGKLLDMFGMSRDRHDVCRLLEIALRVLGDRLYTYEFPGQNTFGVVLLTYVFKYAQQNFFADEKELQLVDMAKAFAYQHPESYASGLHLLVVQVHLRQDGRDLSTKALNCINNKELKKLYASSTSKTRETYLHLLLKANISNIRHQFDACLANNPSALYAIDGSGNAPLHLLNDVDIAENLQQIIPKEEFGLYWQRNTNGRTMVMEYLARVGSLDVTKADRALLDTQRRLMTAILSTTKYYPMEAWEYEDKDGHTIAELFCFHASRLLEVERRLDMPINFSYQSTQSFLENTCLSLRQRAVVACQDAFSRLSSRTAAVSTNLWVLFQVGRKDEYEDVVEDDGDTSDEDEDEEMELVFGVDDDVFA